MSKDKLILAIQSKGRLAEQTHEFFARSGLAISGGGTRGYKAGIDGMPAVEIMFLPSGEIPAQLEAGNVHLGVTGEDLMREKCAHMESALVLLKPLGFGRADLVVAVPRAWIDVDGMADLDEVSASFHRRHGRRLRIATKYLSLTRDFFARHGVSDYRIVESTGATEGAPASGAAEAIVDITSTGASLAANHLKQLDDGLILRSQAVLAASLRVKWSGSALKYLRHILDMIEGKALAQTMQQVQFTPGRNTSALNAALKALAAEGCRTGEGGALHCPNDALHPAMSALQAAGCSNVRAARAEYIFSGKNPLFDDFIRRLN